MVPEISKGGIYQDDTGDLPAACFLQATYEHSKKEKEKEPMSS